MVLWKQGTCKSSIPGNASEGFILTSNLLFSPSSGNYRAADSTARRGAASSSLVCEETQRWPPDKLPFIQTSKSTCPRCFVCLLPLSGPHPLAPVISLSAVKQTSLPDTEIALDVCARPILDSGRVGQEERKSYHMCKTSLNSCLLYSAGFIKCALK